MCRDEPGMSITDSGMKSIQKELDGLQIEVLFSAKF